MADFLHKLDEERKKDAKRWEERDLDLCMLCGAYGADNRSLFISVGYDLKEVIPEILDLRSVPDEILKRRGYYLCICKSCRARLLGKLRAWANECRAPRALPKDHNGYIDEEYVSVDLEANIPVRVHGITVMMTREQYKEWRGRRDHGA